MATLTYPIARSFREHSGWIMFMGIISIVLGAFALGAVGLTTLLSVVYIGAMLCIAGLAQIAFGIYTRKSGNLWQHLAIGVLSVIVGYIVFTRPVENALIITMFLGSYLLVSGLVTLIGSIVEKFPSWGWFAASGVISTVFGLMVLMEPLSSTTWLIGTLVGVDLIFRGATLLQLAWTPAPEL